MPATSISLFNVTLEDGDELAKLRIAAMQESLEAIGRFNPERAKARFLDGFDPKNTRSIESNGSRIGFVVVRAVDDHLLLDHLYIEPPNQGVGYGSEVLKIVFSEVDETNQVIRVAALKGSKSNEFYARHGFVLVESAEWDNYYVRQPKREA